MLAFKLLLFALFAVLGLSSPTPSVDLEKRQLFNTYQCGNNTYNRLQVGAAHNQASLLLRFGRTVGTGRGYPHRFNNIEGLAFPVPEPFYIFPIKKLGVYLGGPPGPDRVVFNDRYQFAGLIKHPPDPDDNSFSLCDRL